MRPITMSGLEVSGREFLNGSLSLLFLKWSFGFRSGTFLSAIAFMRPKASSEAVFSEGELSSSRLATIPDQYWIRKEAFAVLFLSGHADCNSGRQVKPESPVSQFGKKFISISE